MKKAVVTGGAGFIGSLKIKTRNELIPLNVLVLLLIVVIILLPSNGLRIALGLPFLLFFPGYTLVAALFPKRESLEAIERMALSFGISIAVVSFIGLILNYTHWGIRLEPVLYSVTSFIFTTSIVAWLRRKRLPKQERFGIEFQLKAPGWGRGTLDRVLSIILVVAVLGALGMLGYVIATPKVGERFTEFYILGLSGKATDYPKEIRVGEEAKVIVGIVNHEHEMVTYRVEVNIDGVKNNEVGPILLANEQKWEEIVSFTPDKTGDNQKVDLMLYKNQEAEPCLEPLHLWIDVTE